MSFLSFSSLLRVFSPMSENAVRNMVVRKKVDRGTGAVCAVRIIGSIIRNEEEEAGPMLITVGGSPLTDIKESNGSAVVLCRKDCTWNSMENVFSCQLEGKQLSTLELEMLSSSILGKENLETHSGKYSFSITWRRESKTGGERLTLSRPNPGCVLGQLEVNIPYVLIREEMHSHEILLALSTVMPL